VHVQSVEAHAGPLPEASALARRDAARSAASANLRHEAIALQASDCALLPLLDGTRTRVEIAAAHWPALSEAERLTRLDAALASLGHQALLVR